jgi:hypothetical protein
MSRGDELVAIIPEDSLELVISVIDDVIFLEERLTELKQLPFIEVNPKNPMKQRSTPASKLYKEFLQQYINCIKMIEGVIYRDKRLEGDEPEESPLRKWFRDHADDGK